MVVGEMVQEVDLVVLGAGPGGYTAALRAAELGIKTILVDAMPKPGGVCLHMGCIPSKALLHAAEVINTAKGAGKFGLHFAEPKLNVEELRTWKTSVTDKLAQGIVGMCKSSGVDIIHGQAKFNDSKSLRVDCPGESAMRIKFKHCILATGSRPTVIPKLFKSEKDQKSPRIVDSTGALNLENVPKSLLVVGGGYIGLEMGTVYSALGSEVTVVEMTDGLLPGVDRDLVKPLATHLSGSFKNIWLSTTVVSLEEVKNGVEVTLKGKDVPEKMTFEKVLIAVGRRPNSDNIGLESTQVTIDAQGFVTVDEQCRTSDKKILAIGDVSGQPMLAHRAMRQGMVAAEVLAGRKSAFDNRAIPAVVFTEPEIAWAGITETEAKAQGKEVAAAKFPWSASGRAMTLAEPVGQTKVIYDPETTAVLGVGMVGPRAGELIAEAVIAIEMGAVLEDLVVAIHPHPTLSETVMEASMAAVSRIERKAARDMEKAGK
ncbi:MAG: dihydrolipoyl dehydrogenase [Candidatus Melainabacteria bacterium]|jgi:dihydrolipoamide dehydrogenase|nr:dihydrolipoyl dehydrogenase [Candidatus Melainabacteria bacterium]